jgi:hypothetical protein
VKRPLGMYVGCRAPKTRIGRRELSLPPCAADGQPLPAHMHAASSIRLYRQTDRSEETRVFEAEAGRIFQVAVDHIFQVYIPRLKLKVGIT